MANSYFRFKEFCIHQDRCAMKVGTDGVLLGAWADVEQAKRVLDIGTGTGLVALMIAQRCTAVITALEIDPDAAGQANENVTASLWRERIKVLCDDFNNFRPTFAYDVIVCNPPYFVDSLVSPEQARSRARHNDSLTYTDLFQGVSELLASEGRFTLITPSSMELRVKEIAVAFQLYPSRQLHIITSPGKPSKRVLIEFSRANGECLLEEMLIEKERHCYGDEYISLTKPYYLFL